LLDLYGRGNRHIGGGWGYSCHLPDRAIGKPRADKELTGEEFMLKIKKDEGGDVNSSLGIFRSGQCLSLKDT